ncbi:MAG: DUF2235 domain-containing protein [Pseudomonadota bacterium]
MPRNLILCLDGTNNAIGDYQTNVVRFFRGLLPRDDQIPYYAQGIGTVNSQDLGEPEPETERVRGMAFGQGLEDIVLETYRFLCRSYDFDTADDGKKRDRIYIFGFSRGAYAARMLAGFLNEFGLLKPPNLHMAVHIFREYLALRHVGQEVDPDDKYLPLRRYAGVFRPVEVPVEGLILFDTVASMIRFPGWRHKVPLLRPTAAWQAIKANGKAVRDNWRDTGSVIELANHPSTSKNPSVRFVLHALAVDERRTFFRPLLWSERENAADFDDLGAAWSGPWNERDDTQLYFGNRFKSGKPEKQIVRQVWFPGVHGDVGGSAQEDVAQLGKITACWIFDQLAELAPDLKWSPVFHERYLKGEEGRESEDGRPISSPDPRGPVHRSLTGVWRAAELIPKTVRRREPKEDRRGYYLPLGERRHIAPGSLVHRAVFDKRRLDDTYDPPALKALTREDFPPDDHPALRNPSYPVPAEDG